MTGLVVAESDNDGADGDAVVLVLVTMMELMVRVVVLMAVVYALGHFINCVIITPCLLF